MPDLVRPDLLSDEWSDIGDLLEAVTRRPDWHADAACKEAPLSVSWFPEGGQSGNRAKVVCRRCLVRSECLSWALTQGSGLQGIFGGLSQSERAKVRGETRAA